MGSLALVATTVFQKMNDYQQIHLLNLVMAFLCGIERLKIVKETDSPGGGEGGYSLEFLVWVYRTVLETLTRFQTKKR